MNIQEYFKNKENVKTGAEYFDLPESDEFRTVLMKRITCNDGFSMSVQASSGMYCSPRITLFNTNGFIYDSLEIGFPSKKEPLIMEYCDNPDKPTETVYGYVPVEVVNAVLEKHGGIKTTK